MNKDLLITIGGVGAVAAMVCGAGIFVFGGDGHKTATPAKTAETTTAEETHKGTETKTEKTETAEEVKRPDGALHAKGESAPQSEDAKEDLDRDQQHYSDLVQQGKYNDAYEVAKSVSDRVGPMNAYWANALAEMTFFSTVRPSQQRFQEAYKAYAHVVSLCGDKTTQEWPRFQSVVCLKKLGRLDEAIGSMKVYLETYPKGRRTPAMRLMYAECLAALGQRPEALEQLKTILAGDAADDIKADAMKESGDIDRTQAAIGPLPASQRPVRAEVVNLNPQKIMDAAVPATKHAGAPAPVIEETAKPGEPPLEVQALIDRDVEIGKIDDARKILRRWYADPTNNLTDTQKASLELRLAQAIEKVSRSQVVGGTGQ